MFAHMKTAVIRFSTAIAGVATLGSAFLAAPAFAQTYNPYQNQPSYGYPQQQVTNVCTSRFDPDCILKETQSFVSSYFNGFNQNQYQQPSYQYQTPYQNSYMPSYNYNSYPSYQNQYQPSYPTYNNSNHYSYNSNPYSSGYTSYYAPSYAPYSYGYQNSYPTSSYNSSMYNYSGYQYQYSYQY